MEGKQTEFKQNLPSYVCAGESWVWSFLISCPITKKERETRKKKEGRKLGGRKRKKGDTKHKKERKEREGEREEGRKKRGRGRKEGRKMADPMFL